MEQLSEPIGGQVDIREIARIIWRKKTVIVVFLFIAQLGYLALHISSPRLYTTSTRFIFKDSQSAFGGLGGLADLVGFRSQTKTNLSDFFDVIVYNEDFLERIVQRKWIINGDSAYLRDYWNLEPLKGVPNEELKNLRREIGMLKGEIRRFSADKYLAIEKDKRSNLVVVETRFPDSHLSFDINRFVVDLLNDHLLNNTKSQVGENRRFVQKRLEEVSIDLRKSEDGLLAFQMRNQSMTSPPILMELSRLRRGVEINQQIYLELKKQLEMARIEELKESPLIEIISPAQLPLYPDRRLNIKRWLVMTWVGLVMGILAAWGIGTWSSRGMEKKAATGKVSLAKASHS